jgi:hypothetical protein
MDQWKSELWGKGFITLRPASLYYQTVYDQFWEYTDENLKFVRQQYRVAWIDCTDLQVVSILVAKVPGV